MDVTNGDIISLVSLPDFDINKRSDVRDKSSLIKLQRVFMKWVQFLKPLPLH